MRRQQPERAEQRAIVELLERLGAKVYVLGTTRPKGGHMGTCQTPGIPDLCVFLGGFMVWIEVKAPKGRVSVAQEHFERLCGYTNTPYLRGGLDVVIAWLRARGLVKE
jgi:Holliday junction resolvase